MTSQAQSDRSSIAGARASNAGDAFHELWALRAALELLVPGTPLTAVSVEGVPTETPTNFQYDGVDCGLFYGGTALEKADRVELLQLKYSTSDQDSAWTIARLTYSKAKKGNSSVLRRLADSYKEAAAKIAEDSKLTIKLVSNQPLAAEVLEAVAKVRSGDLADPNASKVVTATGLAGAQLTSFLNALDFSDMSAASRTSLQDSITRLISEISNDQADVQALALQGRIGKLMLPGAEREVINLQAVLSWFGINSTAAIFPAPADLKAVNDPIERAPANELRDVALAGNKLICLHGRGGCGKTTTMMQLTELLPADSISVVFDCYGAGSYSHTNDRRHLPERAFLQICNELASKLGVPLLLAHSSRNPADIRVFLERVTRAADLLAQVNPQAILTILIDAADNSVTAAEKETPATCFVWDIAGADLAKLPANVRIIMSSRTGRKQGLRLPAGTPEIHCPPFSRTETQAYARRQIATLTDDWLDQFQALSEGVPRVQAAAFTKGGTSPNDVLEALQPGKTLENVLQDLFHEAANKSGNTNFYTRCITALSVLPPPIPLRHLAAICATNEATIIDFVSDVQPSLRILDETVRIADEDVEDFLQDAAAASQARLTADVCDYFDTLYAADEYAATHYCDLLAKAGRAAKILPILEHDRMLVSIPDPVVRREVHLRRLRLAMQACRSAKSTADTIKVILLSAEAAKDEVALQELLKREAELSVRFAAGSLFRLVLADRDQYSQQGAVLIQDAARAAQAGDLVTARERLRAFGHWMRERENTSSRKQQKWKLEVDEVVALAETRAILDGASFATNMWKWRPLRWGVKVAMKVAPRLIVTGRRALLEEAYDKSHLPTSANLFLTVPLALVGHPISSDRLENELSSLKRKIVPNLRRSSNFGGEEWTLDYLELIVTACEIAFSRKVKDKSILHALDLILQYREQPSSVITRGEAVKIDIAARAWLLRRHIRGETLKSEEFIKWAEDNNPLPEKKGRGRKPTPPKKAPPGRDDELSRSINAVFPTYLFRLEVLKESLGGMLAGKPKTEQKYSGSDSYYFDREYYGNQFRARAAQSIARLMHIDGLSSDYLLTTAEAVAKVKSDGPFSIRSLPVWLEFLPRTELHNQLLINITARSQALLELRTAATDKANKLLEFSKAILPISELDAQAIFHHAVKIALEIDREAMIQIEFVAGLATRHEDIPQDLRRSLAALFSSFVTDVAIRLEGEEHFPWGKATAAIYDFSPEICLAAVSQWQDEGVADLGDTFRIVLKRLVLQPDRLLEACALAGLLKYVTDGLIETLAKAAEAAPPQLAYRAFELLAKKCLLDVPPGHREALGLIVVQHLPKNLETGPYVARLKLERDNSDATERVSGTTSDTEPDRAPLTFATGANFMTPEGIEAAHDEVRSRKGAPYYSRQDIYIAMRKTVIAPASKVPFLTALGSFTGNAYEADARAIALLEALDAWKGQLAIENWRRNDLPKVIAKNLLAFASYLRESPSNLPALMARAELQGDALIEVVASALEANGANFGSTAIIGLCEILAPALKPDDASTIAKWYIERLSEKVPADTVCRYQLVEMPVGFDQALGRFLFAQLSDIDTRIRWRAAHVIRVLAANLGSTPVEALLAGYDRERDDAFRIREAPFYWMAARMWAMMAVARVALETPVALVGSVPMLLKVATDQVFPHYIIRSYAKASIESLVKSNHVTLKAKAAASLVGANVPKKTPLKAKQTTYRELERFDQKDRRYNFNSLDTIPYWYNPLYRLFAALTPDKFFSGIEGWLVDRWKVDPEANWWDKEPRKSRLREREGMMSHHGHGSLPTLERYGTYLEIHGMLCALGEWLATEALIEPEDSGDTLEYWAKRWKPTEYPGWTADRRGPTPSDGEFSLDSKGVDSHWMRRVPKQTFLATVCGGDGANPDALTVYGDWAVASVTRETHIDMDAALVEPSSAAALLRTINKGERQFWLPTENVDNDEIPYTAPFRLYGWLSHLSGDTELDKHDPLRKEADHLRIVPAASLTKKYALQPFGVPVQGWKPDGNADWFQHETWGDSDEREYPQKRRHSVGVNGSRLRITKDALLKIMRGENLDLIVDIQMERRLENEYGETSEWGDKKRRCKNRKVFIFRQDGSIEDECGRIGAWR